MNPPVQTRIRLDSVQVTKIDFCSTTFEKEITSDTYLSLEKSLFKNQEDEHRFRIAFLVTLLIDSKEFELELKAVAHFFSLEPVTEEFLKSDFAQINAPAISFPFLRAYIANFTVNSGFNPIMLPAFIITSEN